MDEFDNDVAIASAAVVVLSCNALLEERRRKSPTRRWWMLSLNKFFFLGFNVLSLNMGRERIAAEISLLRLVMFYFKPPRGNVQLQQLHDSVVARLTYFIKVDSRTFNDSEEQCLNFEHMIPGSSKDRAGHFILRYDFKKVVLIYHWEMVCELDSHQDAHKLLLTYGSYQLKEFVIRSETKLFIKRIDSYTTKDLIQFLKTSNRQIEEFLKSTQQHSRWLQIIFEVLEKVKSCVFKSHYINFHHNETCSQYVLTVPFQFCLSLVKTREISLASGNGEVPCGKWKKLLESLFYCHLDFGLKEIALQEHLLHELNSDSRLLDLKNIVLEIYNNSVEIENNVINDGVICANQVEEISSFFPPCMLILYSNLRTKHRLSHQARFDFSLYLKDIGMPLNESMLFWKHEYSKPKNCSNSGCSHSWQHDSVRFEYSIRHLYGLEGGRKNYKAPSCSRIHSSVLGPTSEGGCPFLHENSLVSSLNSEVIKDNEVYNEIVDLITNKKPRDACFLYSKILARQKCPTELWNYETLHSGPVQFYHRVKDRI